MTHIEGMLMDEEVISKLSKPAKRINVTFSESVLSRIDGYADSVGETRSGFLANAALEFIPRHSR